MQYGTETDKRKASILQNNGEPALGAYIRTLDNWSNYPASATLVEVQDKSIAQRMIADYLLSSERKPTQEQNEIELLTAAHHSTCDKRLGAMVMHTGALERAKQQFQTQEQNTQGGED